MQASECVVCHKTLDPVAGLFQDYWRFDRASTARARGAGSRTCSPPASRARTCRPSERWRALQWLGERTAKDPRFAVAMVEHVYYILTGRKVLLPPKDLDDPLYAAKRRAYQEQRRQIEAIAARFAKSGFNLKNVFKDWIVSDFYRADGLATARRRTRAAGRSWTTSASCGCSRRSRSSGRWTPIFGEPWGRLNDQLAMLYGGIDSKEVTERATDPSGAMGAIQRILSNDVACKHVARDFALQPAERRLFPGIEPDVLPGSSPEADAAIRQAIVHLHELVLGATRRRRFRRRSTRTFELFAGIVADAKEQKGIDKRESVLLPGQRARRRRTIRTTPSAPGAAW